MALRVIYKYEIQSRFGSQELLMPSGAQILSCKEQRGSICIWAMVNPLKAASVKRVVDVLGTGTNIHDSEQFTELFAFVGTVVIGAYVFHVFINKA
jgi:hypothetical protein